MVNVFAPIGAKLVLRLQTTKLLFKISKLFHIRFDENSRVGASQSMQFPNKVTQKAPKVQQSLFWFCVQTE